MASILECDYAGSLASQKQAPPSIGFCLCNAHMSVHYHVRDYPGGLVEFSLELWGEKIKCIVCGSEKLEADTVIMQGKWSRLFNYSNKQFTAVSCLECGHTMLFKKEAKFSVVEALMG